MSSALIAGLLAGYGVALPVGAVATYVVTLTARTSVRVGIAAALGVATADGMYALFAVLGGAALSATIKAAAVPLRWTSVLVLLLLAARTASSARRSQPRRNDAPSMIGAAGAYGRLVLLTLLNPLTIVYFAALVAGAHSGAPVTLAEQLTFVVAAFAASATWQILLAGSGAVLGRILTSPGGQIGTALISSAVIVALAVRQVLT